MYQTSVQTTSDEQLNYSIDTKQGKVLAPVTIKAVDLVKFPEMNKKFAKVDKEEERYTKHYRTVCTYDDDGNVEECHQEEYYTWDTTERWSLSAKQVDMAGRKYPIDLFSLSTSSVDAKDIIKGEDGRYVYVEAKVWIDLTWGANEGDKRYSYDVLDLPKSGTVFLNLSEHVQPVFGSKVGLHIKTPEELVKQAQNGVQVKSTIFTVLWVILILAELGFLGYAVFQYDD